MLDARKLSKPLRKFVKDVRTTAKEYGVEIILSDKRSVGDDKPCNGYFQDGDKPTLAVACGQSFRKWLLVLVHESCHMDQWIEQVPEWTNNLLGTYETMDIIDLWCDHKIELSEEQLDEYIAIAREVELDCEKRSVEKIKEYNLPIDIDEYIQKANAYVWFYTMIKETRQWYKIGREPYNIKRVWSALPTHFVDDYNHVPKEYRELFLDLVD